jgi:hypothetical protein
MASYTPPKINEIPFTFTSGGYEKPDFSKVAFSYKEIKSDLSSLTAAINVLQLYQKTTYTYVKDCRTIIVGYTENGVQTITLPCRYGGIRDLGGYLYGNPVSSDLGAYIKVISTMGNLNALIRGTIKQSYDIKAYIKSLRFGLSDLPAFLLGNYIKVDLKAYLNIISTQDLNAFLNPSWWHLYKNLPSYIKPTIQQHYNLGSIVNIIEIKNLDAFLTGDWWHGIKDLISNLMVFQSGYKDFNITLHSWDLKDLRAIIDQIYSKDLNAYILSTLHLDLSAFLFPIVSKNLRATLQGFDYLNLPAFLLGVYGPNDLRAFIQGIPGVDLKARIMSYLALGTTRDLKAKLESYFVYDLIAYVYGGNILNLNAYLKASGEYADLYAWIFPKLLHVKRTYNISLMNITNLGAIINSSCFSTSFSDLNVKLYAYASKVLNAYLNAGESYGGDLCAKINVTDIMVEDKLDVSFFVNKNYTTLHIDVSNKAAGLVFDTLDVFYSHNIYRNSRTLQAYLMSTRFRSTSTNLTATIKCVTDAYYTSQSMLDNSHLRLGVYKLQNTRLDWRREIEILFKSQAKNYGYVEGTHKAYRLDASKHWIIGIEGFDYVPGIGVERGKVKQRYLFDLRKYKDIDAAIRDAIERVSVLKSSTLKISINGVISTWPYKDLNTYLYSRSLTGALRNFNANLIGWSINTKYNLVAYLNGHLPIFNLKADIKGVFYAAPKGSKVDFDFTQKDHVNIEKQYVDLNFEDGV